MDTLVFWGFVLLALVVITPFMAMAALRRSRVIQDELTNLRKEHVKLRQYVMEHMGTVSGEQSGTLSAEQSAEPADHAVQPEHRETVKSLPVTQAAAAPVVPVIPVIPAVPATEPVVTAALSESSAGSAESAAPQVTPAAPAESPWATNPSPFRKSARTGSTDSTRSSGLSSWPQWLVKGNILAKIGILLLFIGLSYLLKFSIENNILTPEFRLIGSALLCTGLFIVAWRVRDKNRLYSLIVQGGSLGGFYLTVFASYKLYAFLPLMFALVIMVLLCAASVFFAIMQRAVSLAVLAVAGGYVAPILLSDHSGNYVGLFSYYLMLSATILVINHWQGWRVLNILGFAFTFVVGTLWGINDYQPEYYVNCQIFIVANLLLYGLLTQQYARHHKQPDKQGRLQMSTDSLLLFAPPVLAFALQYGITDRFYLGPALSALAFGLLYLLLAMVCLRRFNTLGHRLTLGFLLLCIGFISLSVPLAFSADVTALVWTVEGLMILWFSFLQQQRILRWCAAGLVMLGFASFVFTLSGPFSHWPSSWVFTGQWAGLMVAGMMHYHYRPAGSAGNNAILWLIPAVLVWLLWLVNDPLFALGNRFFSGEQALLMSVVLSAWVWFLAGRRLRWAALYSCTALLWVIALLMLMNTIDQQRHLLGNEGGSYVWLPVFLTMAAFIRLLPSNAPQPVNRAMHVATFWALLLACAAEVLWIDSRLPWGMDEWAWFINLLALSGVIFVLHILQRIPLPPMNKLAGLYWQSTYPLTLLLILLLIGGNTLDGQLSLWPYIPLINPLDEAGMFGIAALWVLRNALIRTQPKVLFRAEIVRGLNLTMAALAVWWANGILIRALAYADDTVWSFAAVMQSRLIQTTLAIVWALLAVILMITAARSRKRMAWLAGAGILALVIIKLFIVDMNQSSGLARAFAFIGVALLVLIVGYFSPLPPKAAGMADKKITRTLTDD